MSTPDILTPEIINPLTYRSYRELVDELVANNGSTGPDQTEERIAYTKLNQQRMKRVEKQFVLNADLLEVLQQPRPEWHWVVLVESWCGDGAQQLPVLAAIADAVPTIELTVMLRDENPAWMDTCLTNGSRAIPKLICLNAETNERLFTWGPRPLAILEQVLQFEEKKPGRDQRRNRYAGAHPVRQGPQPVAAAGFVASGAAGYTCSGRSERGGVMKLIIIAIFLASLTSMCGHERDLETDHKEVIQQEQTLALNGTERWKADEPTNWHMVQLQGMLEEFGLQAENKSAAAYNDLGACMQAELQELFKNCRMQGPAHDMLHLYLVPLVEDVNVLAEKDEYQSGQALARVSTRLKVYNQYFE
jgi:hypothetical protein